MKKDIKKTARLKTACFTVLVFLTAAMLSGILSSCSKPLVIPGVSIGYFIWKDSNGRIRIAWSNTRKNIGFSGIIRTDGDFTVVEKPGFEEDDKISQSAKEISFDAKLSPEDYADEIIITATGYSYIDFNLKIDGKYDLSRINIGKYLNNPLSEEFRLEKNYFENLKNIPWYNNHPFAEFFSKLYANKYLTFIYIYLLGAIIIGLIRITRLSAARKKTLITGILHIILFVLDSGFIMVLWYANGH